MVAALGREGAVNHEEKVEGKVLSRRGGGMYGGNISSYLFKGVIMRRGEGRVQFPRQKVTRGDNNSSSRKILRSIPWKDRVA